MISFEIVRIFKVLDNHNPLELLQFWTAGGNLLMSNNLLPILIIAIKWR